MHTSSYKVKFKNQYVTKENIESTKISYAKNNSFNEEYLKVENINNDLFVKFDISTSNIDFSNQAIVSQKMATGNIISFDGTLMDNFSFLSFYNLKIVLEKQS